jgi:hypothetical protein
MTPSPKISEYIKKIAEKIKENNIYIYRGQCKQYEPAIVSGAIRRLKNSNGSKRISKAAFDKYHKDLIKDAKSYRYEMDSKLNNTELLMYLTHLGAATGLIDFTKDMLVALWFACEDSGEKKENGYVYCLAIDGIREKVSLIDELCDDEPKKKMRA